ncbi:MAG: cysteine desulfurase [Alphaproteobacteria bacterium]|nr:cysteine desulfurase [Alphaproteobacteria bacterium]
MSERPLYLDHNATTPLLPAVLDAMLPWLREGFGNPSSDHVYGRRARDAVEDARARVAGLLGCAPAEVVFTSGGTESNNLAIRGTALARPERRGLVTSVVEHPATLRPVELLASRGWRVRWLPVDGAGQVAEGDLEAVPWMQVSLATVMLANNETGAVQPVAALARRARAHGALVHTDAAQAVGRIPVDVDALGVDLLTVAGHKLYAPKGVGALYVRTGSPLAPMLLGGGQERGVRPGTENVASIVGLGAACAIAATDLEAEGQRQRALRDILHARLAAAIPGLALNGPAEARLPNTLNLRFPGVNGRALLARASGLVASTGAACHAEGEQASAVIRAMGVPEAEALGSVRLSLGRGTREAQVTQAAEQLIASWTGLTAGK